MGFLVWREAESSAHSAQRRLVWLPSSAVPISRIWWFNCCSSSKMAPLGSHRASAGKSNQERLQVPNSAAICRASSSPAAWIAGSPLTHRHPKFSMLKGQGDGSTHPGVPVPTELSRQTLTQLRSGGVSEALPRWQGQHFPALLGLHYSLNYLNRKEMHQAELLNQVISLYVRL